MRPKTEGKRDRRARSAIVATPKHYETLEDILLKLKTMSEKELWPEEATLQRERDLLKEFHSR